MVAIIIWAVVAVIFGICTAKMSIDRKLDSVIGFIIGFFLLVFGVITIILLSIEKTLKENTTHTTPDVKKIDLKDKPDLY